VFVFFNINSHLPYDMLSSCHTIGMTMRTLVFLMNRFLLIFSFWDVSTVKKRTWSNQDIQARPLVLTTVALTRVWVIKFRMYEYYVIWQLQVFFSCRSRTIVDSFSGLMNPSWSIDKLFFSRMIGMSLFRYGLSSVGFLRHQIHHQWQMKRRTKQVPVVSAAHLRANVATVLSWWIRLQGWITHHFFVVRFLYQ
jgi:predicted membrane protein